MATTFEMPGSGIRTKAFDLNISQEVTPVEGGFVQGVQRTIPLWILAFETAPLRAERYNEWVAFIDSLNGVENSFLAWDPRRTKPFAYLSQPLANTPWGTANVVGADYTASTLSLTFTNSTTITKGDYISFIRNNAWNLHRAMETKTGTSMTIRVRARPTAWTGSTINARLNKAAAEFKLLGKPTWKDSVDSLPVLTFTAAQFIARSS